MLEMLRRTLQWRWPLVLAIFVPATVVGVIAVGSQPSSAESVSVVGVVPEQADTVTADLVRLTLGRYGVELTSLATLDAVAEATGVDTGTLDDAVTVSSAVDAGTLSIVVRLSDERTASLVNAAFTQQAVDLGQDDIFMDAQVLSEPRLTQPGLLASPAVLQVALGLAALVIAILIAYLTEVVRPRVRTGGDAADAAGAPVLGSLPPFVGPWPRQQVVDDGEILKAARTLRNGMASSARDVPRGATCVVGAADGVGATTVAFLLARTIADRGESTLLLDLDLEHAGLSRKLEHAAEHDLMSVLTDHAALEEVVRYEGAVAVAGLEPAPEADDIIDRRLPDLLKQAGDRYDPVLVDVAPLRSGEISEVVASHTASAILVVRLGGLRSEIERSARRLAYLGVPLRGVVVNYAARAEAEGASMRALLQGDDA